MPGRIIVLGMFRSGTSLSTRLVQEWGAYAGAEEELFGDRYGYLEHLGLQKLNDDLTGGTDRVPPSPEDLIACSEDPRMRDRAARLLETMDQQAEEQQASAWVWKDPRLPMVLPFWARVWGDVVYVIPVRNPVETIFSGANMEGLPAEAVPLSAGFVYWQFNMLNILGLTHESRRKIFVPFDRLIRKPIEECTRLCSFLDEQIERNSSDAKARIERMAGRVQSGERHYEEARSLAEIEQATREQRSLYNFLRIKALYPDETYNREDFALYPGWREYLETIDMLVGNAGSQDMPL